MSLAARALVSEPDGVVDDPQRDRQVPAMLGYRARPVSATLMAT